ncbi:two-component system response regulator, partial [Mesorhizobium sp. M7A.F.Ca.MR.148.00.0.0]
MAQFPRLVTIQGMVRTALAVLVIDENRIR